MPCSDCKEPSLSRVQFNLRQRSVLWLKQNCEERTTELSERQPLTFMKEIPLGKIRALNKSVEILFSKNFSRTTIFPKLYHVRLHFFLTSLERTRHLWSLQSDYGKQLRGNYFRVKF